MVATAEQRCVMEEGGCETFMEAYDLLANAVLVERIGMAITPLVLQQCWDMCIFCVINDLTDKRLLCFTTCLRLLGALT